MMRNKAVSSMQKTYDECYLTCSTAVFFEGQNNEAEALRSWRSALDQIHYHNAYRVSSSYLPKTETEKALYESLKQMELQCKERVDLLEALRQSRKDAGKDESAATPFRRPNNNTSSQPSGWLGNQTVAPMQYSDLPNPSPAVPSRPPVISRNSNASVNDKSNSRAKPQPSSLPTPPTLPVPQQPRKSRSPSPDAGKRTMKKTLRSGWAQRPPKTSAAQVKRPAPMKAAGVAWDTQPRAGSVSSLRPDSDPTIEARLSSVAARRSLDQQRYDEPRWTETRGAESRSEGTLKMPDPADYITPTHWRNVSSSSIEEPMDKLKINSAYQSATSPYYQPLELDAGPPPPPPPHAMPVNPVTAKQNEPLATQLPKAPDITYRQEYLPQQSKVPASVANSLLSNAYGKQSAGNASSSGVTRKPVAPAAPPPRRSQRPRKNTNTDSDEERTPREKPLRPRAERKESSRTVTPPSTDAESPDEEDVKSAWDKRAEELLKNLPKGIDELAAKNILNEIVVKGDEVHWSDVAGLEGAKKALKEAVVYPFLRPDLFMGLREPARGMLLFGPPGTGKTMLARAVATESKSTFFAISASSLTSKWHGESEKLVRALFGMAKALAPSIIFVDEIDSLLNSRGGGTENEASRRSKTEFLIQWSDLQRAAAGKDVSIGDASRVLVLAATNCPWDIDEAARRRFVRRQYIPLPETETRDTQIRTLIGAQKHNLDDRDIRRLVELTEGYSGSDITALAKDAAMGPLRNLGEALLYTPMDQIRPIQMSDFVSSLDNIRPSVSKKGLEEFEVWARDYGERGG